MRQKVPFSPFCSKCSRQSCIHWLTYKRLEETEFVFNHHIHENDSDDSFNDNLIEHEHDDIDHEDSEEEVETLPEGMHWRTMPPIDKYHQLYGYNVTDIIYPFHLYKNIQAGWMERMNGVYSFPKQFIPTWSLATVCKHNNVFDQDDENLGRYSRNIVVYKNIGERLFDVDVMFRNTLANCKCVQQFDSHRFLLWHLGFGRFVDYTLLHLHLHRMRADGIGTYAEYTSITDALVSLGISSTLTYHDLHRAVCGFFRRLKFDEKVAFSCPTHGTTPRFLNTDGKNMGPTKRKVRHLEELERHPNDDEVLAQSTFFAKRVFLHIIKERNLVVELLAENISMTTLCDSENIESENGRLVVNLEL